MSLPTKHERYAYEVGFIIGLAIVGIVVGTSIGYVVAGVMRFLARGVL